MNKSNEHTEPPLQEPQIKRGKGRPAHSEPNRNAKYARKFRANKKVREVQNEELAAEADKYFDREDKTANLDKRTRHNAQVVAEKMVRSAARAVAPQTGMFPPEVLAEARKVSKEAILTMIAAVPKLTEIVIERASQGDPSCIAIVSRWLPSPSDALSLAIPEGLTKEEASDHLLGAALSGQVSIKEAKQGLELLQAGANLELSAAATQRLQALRAKLERMEGIAPANALSSKPIMAPKLLNNDGSVQDLDPNDPDFPSNAQQETPNEDD